MGKLAEEQKQVAIKAYEAGDGTTAIARALSVPPFSVTPQSIEKLLKAQGVWKRRRKNFVSVASEEAERIATLYRDGLSTTAIEKETGRSNATVCGVLKERGHNLTRAQGKLRRVAQETRDKIPVLYDADKTLDEIAEILKPEGVTRGIVYSELRRRGKELRRGGQRGKFHDNPRVHKEIVLRYTRGESLCWLAIWFECSRDPIMKVLREAGIAIRSFDEAVGIQWADRKGRVHYMKSTWEIKTAEWLDAQLVEWDYEKETFTVGRWKGHDVHYTPDFWIYRPDGTLEKLLDVKGWARPRSMWRIDKFRRTHSQSLEVWDEAALLERKIIEPKRVWRARVRTTTR